MEAATTTDRITVKLRRDLHKRLRFKSVAEDLEFTALLDEALEKFLGEQYKDVLGLKDTDEPR